MNAFWQRAQQRTQQQAQQQTQQQPVPLHRPAGPSAPVSYQIVLQGETICYQLRRSQRRSIGFSISLKGLQVTAPLRASLQHIEQALLEKQAWIISKLGQVGREPVLPPLVWGDGTQFSFLGQSVTLLLDAAAPRQGHFDAGLLHLRADPTRVQAHVQRWLESQAYRLFPERLALYAERLGVQVHSFSVSSARTRWGSCSSKGDIRLSWRLMHFDLALIDYVVAHELAHLIEMNHSPRFWAVVARICPNYSALRQQLRQQAQLLRHVF
jgi:predicted metal-dependent hydrolase